MDIFHVPIVGAAILPAPIRSVVTPKSDKVFHWSSVAPEKKKMRCFDEGLLNNSHELD